jgi:MFS family permease
MGNLPPRLPDLQRMMQIEEGPLGFGLIGAAAGTLVSLSFFGPIFERIGYRRSILTMIPLLALHYAIASFAGGPLSFFLLLFPVGIVSMGELAKVATPRNLSKGAFQAERSRPGRRSAGIDFASYCFSRRRPFGRLTHSLWSASRNEICNCANSGSSRGSGISLATPPDSLLFGATVPKHIVCDEIFSWSGSLPSSSQNRTSTSNTGSSPLFCTMMP